MYMKVGQQSVSLQGGVRKPSGFHVVEHLGKDAEIISGRGEAVNPADSPDRDKQKKQKGQEDRSP